MPTYIFRCAHGAASEAVERDCQGREQAIQYARRYLELALQEVGPTAAPPASVSVTEERLDAEPVWLGSWDWTAEDGWAWVPLE
jgi:hypothetical protein